MNKVFGIFLQPFPLEDNRRVQFFHSLIISIAVIIIVILWQPFGLNSLTLPMIKLIPVFAGFGIVTMLCCFLDYRLIRPAFPSFFDDQKWNVWKHIFWSILTIMLIGLGNLFYSRMLGNIGISGSSLVAFLFNIFLISVLPVTIITLLRYGWLYTRRRKEVKMVNEIVSSPITAPSQDSPLIFVSDNGKDAIKLLADHFLYAESADNYTDIVYIENGIVRRALIRSSLKKIEEMNTADFVIRVHRAFLVNMRQVKRINGNAQGFRLVFDHLDETIPVSRRTKSQVTDLLEQIHAR